MEGNSTNIYRTEDVLPTRIEKKLNIYAKLRFSESVNMLTVIEQK
jgi:hypothetical protein